MSLSRVKNWVAEVLTYSDLNAEFNSILNNPGSLICPITFNLTFTDATYDIGASGATRPRNYFGSGTGTFGGTFYIGDTSNADITLGLTINQGANDDHILALKSSDVTHGATTIAETDSFVSLKKLSATNGGLVFYTLADTGTQSLVMSAICATAVGTRSTAAVGPVELRGSLLNGTGVTTMSGDANLVVVTDAGTTRFILDSDGDSHQDVGTAWTNFDAFDDLALLTDLSVAVSRDDDPIKREFQSFLKYNRDALARTKLVTFNEDGHHFVNMSKLTMALTGAVRQLGDAYKVLVERQALLESKL